MSHAGSEDSTRHGEDQGGRPPDLPVPAPVSIALGLFVDELRRYRDALSAIDPPDGEDHGETEYLYIEVPLAKSFREEEIDISIHASTGFIRIRRAKLQPSALR